MFIPAYTERMCAVYQIIVHYGNLLIKCAVSVSKLHLGNLSIKCYPEMRAHDVVQGRFSFLLFKIRRNVLCRDWNKLVATSLFAVLMQSRIYISLLH